MFEFFVMFLVIGAIIGFIVEDPAKAMGVIIVVTVLWAFAFGPWAIATFIELYLGYAVLKKLRGQI